MSEISVNPIAVEPPSKARLLKATAIAIAIAVVILFTAVLPAEYGIDPLGTGKALGLNGLAASASAPAPVVTSAAQPAASDGGVVVNANGEAHIIKGTFTAQPAGYKVDSREIKLAQGEGIEIKYHLQKGAGMVYSWTANQPVFYEFHGEPDVKPAGAGEDYYESYDLDDQVGKKSYNGTFTSPSTGIQGWFWENQTGAPITIKLVTAGFYDYILQNKDDNKTKLQPSDPK